MKLDCHKYDPFTKNPFKLLLQLLLPIHILKLIWNHNYTIIQVAEKYTQPVIHPFVGVILGTTIDTTVNDWLLNKPIKIKYERQTIELMFKYDEDAVMYKLLWS